MDFQKSVIKKESTDERVMAYQPRPIQLDLSDSAKVYLNEENRKKSDFILSELIAQQTGVADVESQSHKDLVEKEVLERLKEVQENSYQEAFSLGKEEGSKAAFESVKSDLEGKLQELSQLVEEIRTLKDQVLKSQEKELIELTYQIGKKIALKELAEDSSVVKNLLESILEDCEKNEEIKIFLSQENFEFISKQMQEGLLKFQNPEKVKLMVEEQMRNGGCRVQTEYGSIDSQVEQRVERAWDILKGKMPRTEENPS